MLSSFRLLPLTAVVLLGAALDLHAEILVKSGDKIAFLGDSITEQGWNSKVGYVHLVIDGLKANGVDAVPIPAGISGHKSNQMLARLRHDVLDKNPQWMTLSCGVNDVWHGKAGVPLDDAQAASGTWETKPGEPEKGTYKKNITAIIDQAQAAGVKPVILTATVIHEFLDSPENEKLVPYNDFLRQLAKERHLPLADLNAAFQARIKADGKPGQNVFTRDGVHMRPEGDRIMATGILQALGCDEAQLAKAREAWDAISAPKPAEPAK
jgi:lysophospholipase L1-like esterase